MRKTTPPPVAIVTILRPGCSVTAIHADPMLVALADEWQRQAANTPHPGSLSAWFRDNRRRFRPGP